MTYHTYLKLLIGAMLMAMYLGDEKDKSWDEYPNTDEGWLARIKELDRQVREEKPRTPEVPDAVMRQLSTYVRTLV